MNAAAAHESFTAEERAAMKERAKELKEQAKQADATAAVLEKINELGDADRAIAERLHELITTEVPELSPKTWYGMPAYAKDGTIICFFQASDKFKTRYSTFGFSDAAALDDGTMWPSAFAVTALTVETERAILSLVKRAVS